MINRNKAAMTAAAVLLPLTGIAILLLLGSHGIASGGGREAASVWRTDGPYQSGASIHSLVVRPTNPNVVWAGTNKGVYRSINGGDSWRAMNTGLGGFGALRAIDLALSPANPDTIYLGSWGSGVYRSTDGGASWQRTGLVPTIAQGQGMTAVEGQEWSALPPVGPSYEAARGLASAGARPSSLRALTLRWLAITDVVVTPGNASQVYAVVWPDGVYRSRDGGDSWQKILDGDLGFGDALVVHPTSPHRLYTAIQFEGIYASNDGGDQWTLTSSVMTDTFTLAVHPTRPNTVYAGTWGRGVHKSTDGGQTWSAANSGLGDTRVRSVAVSLNNPHVVYAGTLSGIYRSSNQGGSWSQVDPSLDLWDVEALAVHPANSNLFYAGSWHQPASGLVGGIYKSTDGGGTLTLKNQGLLRTFVWSLASAPQGNLAGSRERSTTMGQSDRSLASSGASSVLYAGTWGGGVFRSTDGGRTWEEKPDGLDLPYVYAVEIAPTDPDVVYVGTFYNDSGVYKSTDGGETWSEVSEGLASGGRIVFALAVDPTSADNVYAGTWDGIFKSSNGGTTWTETTGLPTQDGQGTEVLALAINPRSPNILYAATYGQGAYKSTDGGQTWFPINSSLPVPFIFDIRVDPDQPATVYAATSNRVYKSVNGGATWRALDKGMPQVAVRALAFDPTNPRHVFAGTHNQGVYWSVNGGEDWAPLNAGLGNLNIRAMHAVASSDMVLHAGTDGEGAWTRGVASLGKLFMPLTGRNVEPSQIEPTPTWTPSPTQGTTATPTPTSTPTAAPADVVVDFAWTTDETNQQRTAFITLDTIKMWLRIINSGSVPATVDVSWEVRDPNGFVVDLLSWSGTITSDPSGSPEWSLTRTIPTDMPAGEYTFTGTVTHAGETTVQTAVFYMAHDLELADDFSDPNSGWPVEDEATYSLGYDNDTYRVFIQADDWWVASTPGLRLTDYVIEADAWQEDGPVGEAGLLFGLTDDWTQFYSYAVDSVGRYRLRRLTSDGWQVLRDWTPASALERGTDGVNHLMVVRQGSQIILYANGRRLDMVDDSALIGGRLGLIGGTFSEPDVGVRFDNYRAYRLGGSPLAGAERLPATGTGSEND